MLTFRRVLTNTGKTPILVNWILNKRKQIPGVKFFTINSVLFKKTPGICFLLHPLHQIPFPDDPCSEDKPGKDTGEHAAVSSR